MEILKLNDGDIVLIEPDEHMTEKRAKSVIEFFKNIGVTAAVLGKGMNTKIIRGDDLTQEAMREEAIKSVVNREETRDKLNV